MKKLNLILVKIANKLDLATNEKEAISKGQTRYLELEYSSFYGGYRLVNVGVENGAHYGAFNESSCVARRSNKKMEAYLSGILTGINANNKN
jgi:hypothetical protein